ncbi:glycoside hydrolase family 19 protein [Pedobacter cryoconitis]|uniref:Chitinase class I n=1 Tax=Pedobacter cryoconitis TaxID=188932 RepID=A0A327S8I5_9SPHI|nr:glycoside hydrolase family 19 protein [Pedobacter cryoconitis]RAJ25380.1 chitinase class I [Pedobacter cryoconitis]
MRQKGVKIIAVVLICLGAVFPASASELNNPGYKNAAEASFPSLLSAAAFNKLFPLRSKFYTYASLMKAVQNLAQLKVQVEKRGPFIYKITRTDQRTGKKTVVRQDKDWNESWAQQKEYTTITIDYSQFCNSADPKTNQKELAAFFAQAAHETRDGADGQFNDGLMLKRELDTTNAYLAVNVVYPAVPGKKYYGRGPLQLSYNGNYGFASDCIFGDKNKLLSDPDLILRDPVVAFETALYFWMTPQGIKPSAHEVITGKWKPSAADQAKGWVAGFGLVTNIINGAIECNHGENVAAMKNRTAYYQHYLRSFGATDVRKCSCGSMQPFP